MDDKDDLAHGAHFDYSDAELENPLENPHFTPASPVSDEKAEDHNGTDDNDELLATLLASVRECKCAEIGDLPTTEDWTEVNAFIMNYQNTTFQNLSTVRSKSVEVMNNITKRESKKRPQELVYYSITFGCIHRTKDETSKPNNLKNGNAEKKKAKSEGKEEENSKEKDGKLVLKEDKRMRFSYDTDCEAFISLSTYYDKDEKAWRFKVSDSNFVHNHAISEIIYKQYPRQRALPDSEVLKALAKEGVSNVKLQNLVFEEHGIQLRLKDIKNYKSALRNEKFSSDNEEARCKKLLIASGSRAHALIADDGNIQVLMFQTPAQKRLYEYYPETILIDTTFSVCSSNYGLLTMMITDSDGHGRPVAFAVIGSECKESLEYVFSKFAESNDLVSSSLRNVVIDKHFTEINAIKSVFPNAQIKLCLFHAIQALQREVCEEKYNLSKDTRKKLKELFPLLGNCTNAADYNTYYEELITILGSRGGKSFKTYFDKNWNDPEMRKLWVSYLIPPNLVGNLTNNRLESFYGKLKAIVSRNFKVDELISELLNFLTSLETESRLSLTRYESGGHFKLSQNLSELLLFSRLYTPFAFSFIKKEYELALSKPYSLTSKWVINAANERLYEANEKSCNCTEFRAYGLPCRHILYVRLNRKGADDLVIPLIGKRWTIKHGIESETFYCEKEHSISLENIQVDTKDTRLKEKVLSEKEKYHTSKPIFDRLQRLLLNSNSKKFNVKLHELKQLAECWENEIGGVKKELSDDEEESLCSALSDKEIAGDDETIAPRKEVEENSQKEVEENSQSSGVTLPNEKEKVIGMGNLSLYLIRSLCQRVPVEVLEERERIKLLRLRRRMKCYLN
jgi:hypothetical protein